VLRHSFVILPRVGERTELKLWTHGILTWEDFLATSEVHGIRGTRKQEHDRMLCEARAAYEERRWAYFAENLPRNQLWRLWPECDDVAYLDIETTGLEVASTVTVVGIHRCGQFTALVHGQNLTGQAIADTLAGVQMIITFNGSMFDLPIIQYHFPGAVPDIPHLDLRFAAKRAGLSGGLKKIEVRLGLKRPDDLIGVDGFEAVRLWYRWKRDGDAGALDTLVRYNREDVDNLPIVAGKIFDLLKGGCGLPNRTSVEPPPSVPAPPPDGPGDTSEPGP
jgi:uncharacterized protein YprB with RNaseH-like and TPR domain